MSFLKHLQGQGLHHLPRQPSPVFYHLCQEEFPPNDQPEPPLEQLETIRGSLKGFYVMEILTNTDSTQGEDVLPGQNHQHPKF